MKKIILLTAFVAGINPSSVQACEIFQALFYANARTIETLPSGKCRVFLSWESGWSYAPAHSCPLDIDEVSSAGVITSCDVKIGDQVSGVAYRSNAETPQNIYLY